MNTAHILLGIAIAGPFVLALAVYCILRRVIRQIVVTAPVKVESQPADPAEGKPLSEYTETDWQYARAAAHAYNDLLVVRQKIRACNIVAREALTRRIQLTEITDASYEETGEITWLEAVVQALDTFVKPLLVEEERIKDQYQFADDAGSKLGLWSVGGRSLTELSTHTPTVRPLLVFLLSATNGYCAVVVARDNEEARHLARIYDPAGWWSTATSELIAECRPSRTCRVLAIERPSRSH